VAGDEVGRFLRASAAFVDDLDDVILNALRGGPRTVAELTRIGDRRLGPFSAMAHELARSVRANLDDLERRGAVVVTGTTPARWTAA
jgi:molybdenum-dependent DNA-binding transcriptional regulator ModE